MRKETLTGETKQPKICCLDTCQTAYFAYLKTKDIIFLQSALLKIRYLTPSKECPCSQCDRTIP